jgi:hypothetical protein
LKEKLFQNNSLEKGCIFHRPNTDPFGLWHPSSTLYIRSSAYVRSHGRPGGDHCSFTLVLVDPAHWAFVHRAVGLLFPHLAVVLLFFGVVAAVFIYFSKEKSP